MSVLRSGILALGLSLAMTGAGQAGSTASWNAWLNGLAANGYSVLRGNATVVDNAACAGIVAVFGSCFGNNAAAPYIVPQVPIGSAYLDPFYATGFTVAGVASAPSNMFYRLADSEALVTVVDLPPRAAYLGYQSYAFSRATTNYVTVDDKRTLSPDPDRYELFASLGNDVNSAVVQRKLGNVWRAGPVAYVTTANAALARKLMTSAKNAGLDPKRIFIEPVGANILTGATSAADDFVSLIRYAVPENAAAANAWRGDATRNVLVYRVSATGSIPVERFAEPRYTKRMPTREAKYQASVTELAGILKNWLAAQQLKPAFAATMIASVHVTGKGEPYGLVGADCITKGTSCLGDNQDTDAYRIGVIGTLQQNRSAFVVGVNHATDNNASYISLAVYNTSTFSGVASASQTNPAAVGFSSGTLTGSAEGVLKALGLYQKASLQLQADLPNLYTSVLARDCTGIAAYCIDLSDTTALPYLSIISVTQRAYLKPGTTTGADPDVMVSPIVVF